MQTPFVTDPARRSRARRISISEVRRDDAMAWAKPDLRGPGTLHNWLVERLPRAIAGGGLILLGTMIGRML